MLDLVVIRTAFEDRKPSGVGPYQHATRSSHAILPSKSWLLGLSALVYLHNDRRLEFFSSSDSRLKPSVK